MSLRQIAEETNLGLKTVRNVTAQAKRTDRTTRKQLARVEPEAETGNGGRLETAEAIW